MERFISFDLETTGVDPTTARIVTYAIVIMNRDGTVEACAAGIVNPGIEIPEEASNVHGVTTERARSEGVEPAEALLHILSVFAVNQDLPVVIYNARYDLTLIMHELHRNTILAAEQEKLSELLADRVVIDPLVIDKATDMYRRGKRTLEVTCKHYGITLEDAHTADADAVAAGQLALALAEAWPAHFSNLERLHSTQVRWAAEQARSLEHYFRYKAPKPDPEAFVEPRWPWYRDAEVPA